MGGLTFSSSKRFSKSEFEKIKKPLTNYLGSIGIHFTDKFFVESVKDKNDFGDIDILIVDRSLINVFDKIGYQKSHIKNSRVYSFLYEHCYQVDLIQIDNEEFSNALVCFSNGGLGAFLGILAKQHYGLKYGFNGLFFEYYYLHKKETFFVSLDVEAILNFLKINPNKFLEEFETEHQAFNYIASSGIFNPSYFQLDSLDAKNRYRQAKRGNFERFVDYITTNNIQSKIETTQLITEDTINVVDDFFGTNVAEQIKDFKKSVDLEIFANKKMNGEIVSQNFCIFGRELGELMKKFNESFTSPKSKQDFILRYTQAQILRYIENLK